MAVERPTPVKDLLDSFGIERICGFISEGMSLTAVAEEVGVSHGALRQWLGADTARSAHAREARMRMATFWEEKAEHELRSAADPFELSKAKELSHHYRWRASKIAPAEYGDKLQHTGPGGDAPVGFVIYGEREAKDSGEWQTTHAPSK
jgi:hypothetical protein